MITSLIALATLIIGVAVGWYCERVLSYIKDLRERLKESSEYKAAGVVRPGVTRVAQGSS